MMQAPTMAAAPPPRRCNWLDLLRLIPVVPTWCGMHRLQAPLLAWLRTGQWLQRGGLQTNWCHETWTIRKGSGVPSREEVLLALAKCESLQEQRTSADAPPQLRLGSFHVHTSLNSTRYGAGHGASFFSCFFFTAFRQWLDVCELTLEENAAGDALVVSAYSFSASVVPASSPFAPLMALLLFWIVFSDIGQNKIHLRTLRMLLVDEGFMVAVDP